MKIRKLDSGDLWRPLAAQSISVGRDMETKKGREIEEDWEPENDRPEPLLAPLEKYRVGEAFLDGRRNRWMQISSLGADGPRSNKAMRGL